MSAHCFLARYIREARPAIVRAADALTRYVSPDRGDLKLSEVRRLCRAADAKLRRALFCAVACTSTRQLPAWAAECFEEACDAVEGVVEAFDNATEQVEQTRFRRTRRQAETCAYLCRTIALLDAAEVEAHRAAESFGAASTQVLRDIDARRRAVEEGTVQ